MPLQDLVRILCCLACLWPSQGHADQPLQVAAPGKLIAVADTHLHVDCTGSGSPTIVLQAGLAGNVLDWLYVQPQLALHHRVCSTERPGAGWSARTERPRSAAAMVEELHLLLEMSGEPRPYVMVGHSLGGMLALYYARLYPGETAGLVLLDAMHPEQFERFERAGVQLPMDPVLAVGRTPAAAALYGLPKQLYPLAMALSQQDKAKVFIIREMRAFVADAREVNEAGLPRLPSRVLVHGNREWDSAFPDGRMERVWLEMQTELAERIGAPPPVSVSNAGHQLALDAPNAVVAAVEDLISTLPP